MVQQGARSFGPARRRRVLSVTAKALVEPAEWATFAHDMIFGTSDKPTRLLNLSLSPPWWMAAGGMHDHHAFVAHLFTVEHKDSCQRESMCRYMP